MSLFENFVYKNGEIVDNSWVKWYHFSVPDSEGSERESMREFLAMLGHCKPCTVLFHPLGLITCNTPLADD